VTGGAPSSAHALLPSQVVSNRCVGPGWYVLRLREPSIARQSRPGQFVQILCSEPGSSDPLLRRPFSVYSSDAEAGTYDIIYTVVGRGTRWLAAIEEPEAREGPETASCLDVIGPFGNTFSPPRPSDRVYLVGGGVGIAPLYFLALELVRLPAPPPITFCMGARTRSQLVGVDELRRLPLSTLVSTDDGTEGFKGRVTELFLELAAREDAPERLQVYGCGPQRMNDSLRAIAVSECLRCEICLESLMACGFGICFGCVAPIRREPAKEYYNRRICCEGPVFDAALLHPGIDEPSAAP
jgi:dihydroorotate dehydrogenase electron transfer subunit